MKISQILSCLLILLLAGFSTQQATNSGSNSSESDTGAGSAGTADNAQGNPGSSMTGEVDAGTEVNKPAATVIQNDGGQDISGVTESKLLPTDVRGETNAQDANPQSAMAEEGTSTVPLVGSTTDSNGSSCDPRSHLGCDIINFERCTRLGVCECLRGYLKDTVTKKCIAAQFFTGQIELANEYTEDLADTNSDAYKQLTGQLQKVLLDAFNNQDVSGILHIKITKISPGKVVVTFEIAVDKINSGGREYLQRQYNQGLTSSAHWDENERLVKLKGTDLVLGANGSIAVYLKPFTETNHCVLRDHNYCDANAHCTHSMRSFSCRCNEGFVDVSPDRIRSPGERCAVRCQCRNNGTCETVNGNVQCRCPKWFIGTNCEINGKDVLIICVSVLGGLLVLTVLLCLICVCAVKNRKSSRSSSGGVGSLDTSVVKLPRVWMDGTRPYELPPRDMRRWSYVSEPVRYMDEYMMDDYVHAETLPLPRSHDAKKRFYPAYGNQAYSSSTLNIRPSSRH